MASDSDKPESVGGAPARLRPVDIARDWGTSRAYASKKVSEGCPTDSLEAARAWRQAHATRGIGTRSKLPPPAPDEISASPLVTSNAPPAPSIVPLALHVELASLESSLAAAITVEEQAHRLVNEAMRPGEKSSVLESRIRAYSVACKNRSEREAAVREELERRKIVVRMDEAKALFGRGLMDMVPKLRALGSMIGIRCNQDNPVLAADTIDAAVRSILASGERAYAA